MFNSINLKLGNARKEQEFTIYPYNGEGYFILQSDTRIAKVDMNGKGHVSKPHSGGAYFIHLSFEHIPIQLTDEQMTSIKLMVLGDGEAPSGGGIVTPQVLTGITF